MGEDLGLGEADNYLVFTLAVENEYAVLYP